jgi:hypothetical protein
MTWVSAREVARGPARGCAFSYTGLRPGPPARAVFGTHLAPDTMEQGERRRRAHEAGGFGGSAHRAELATGQGGGQIGAIVFEAGEMVKSRIAPLAFFKLTIVKLKLF